MILSKLWYVILALLAIIVLLILFWPAPPKPDNSKEKVLQARIDSILNRNQDLVQDHKTDSLATVEKLEASERQIRALKATRAKVIREIDTVILEDPGFQRYVAVTDSIILKQDDTINFLEDALGKEQSRFNQLQSNFDASLNTFREQHAGDVAMNLDLMKDNKRLRLGNKILKAGIAVGVVGGIWLGSRFD